MSTARRHGLCRTLPILAAIATVVVAASSVHAQIEGRTLPSDRDLKRFGLERMWWSQAVINPSRDEVRYMTVDEHNLYVQSSAGLTTCFDAATGRKLWAAQLGRKDTSSYPVTSNEEICIVAGGPMLFAVDKFTGESLWRLRLPAMPSARPTMDDRYIFVGSLDGSLYALDLKTIRDHFQDGLLPEWSGETVAWRYQSGQEITTPPISTGRVVNFASKDRSLYCVQISPRKLLWQFETDAAVNAPLASSGRLLYLASRDFNFYCLDVENGSVQWQFVSGLPVTESPRVIGDQVFLMPTRGGMYALDAATGRSLWWQQRITGFVAASPSTVYGSDKVGNLVMMDREDGSTIGAIPLRHFTTRYANDRSDRIFMATQGGIIVAIRETGREFPIFHRYPDRLPLLPEFAEPDPADEPTTDGAADDDASN